MSCSELSFTFTIDSSFYQIKLALRKRVWLRLKVRTTLGDGQKFQFLRMHKKWLKNFELVMNSLTGFGICTGWQMLSRSPERYSVYAI